MIDRNHGWNVSFKPLFVGFVISLLLAIGMYRIADRQILSGDLFTLTIFSLAIAQALVQLFFFMHVGLEKKPHWISISFLFTLVVILIIIGGSIWIMNHLNYNMMPMPENMPTHGAF